MTVLISELAEFRMPLLPTCHTWIGAPATPLVPIPTLPASAFDKVTLAGFLKFYYFDDLVLAARAFINALIISLSI